MRLFGGRRKKRTTAPIDLDEVLLDAGNLPAYNRGRLEGRLAPPLSSWNVYAVGGAFALIALVFFVQVFRLQVVSGSAYREQSERNRLDSSLVIAARGLVYDRTGERLVWNADRDMDTSDDEPRKREYTPRRGLGQFIGYANAPKKDHSGVFFRTSYEGVSGIEAAYDAHLAGENGAELIEVDATGVVVSSHIARPAHSGMPLSLSVDAEFSEVLHDALAEAAQTHGFRSGGGAVMDIETGEIVAIANVPSFNPSLLARADAAEVDALKNDERFPFLNRVVDGLYTPGSVIKPFVAYAALVEGVISPEREILSTGSLVVQNPYDPERPSVFRDWRAHGLVDMRRAIALSSNVYFYTIGGGFGGQKGLGITRIEAMMRNFGFGEPVTTALGEGKGGIVPNPAWKQERFGEDWRLGDTYHTAIGQFGFQITPLQLLRAYGALANGGTLLTPQFVLGERTDKTVSVFLVPEHLAVVREGMRQSVEYGTARSLLRSDVAIAAKTGTAEVGAGNAFINSWVAGYFPYVEPRYAFVALLENGPRENLFGAAPTMSRVFDWLSAHRPEYLHTGEAP